LVTAFHLRGGNLPLVSRALTPAQLESICQEAAQTRCDASIIDYVVELVRDTRQNPRVRLGGSPRSAQYLLAAAKARAALNGVDFVTPDDVKDVAFSVLNHRLLLKAEAEVEGTTTDDVIRQTLERVAVPR